MDTTHTSKIGKYFNPRSPHGERHTRLSARAQMTKFQSTLPARGATRHERTSLRADTTFQSTLPARGATQAVTRGNRNLRFQSTLPARGATRWTHASASTQNISIHAPRTGSDAFCVAQVTNPQRFQSTLPARGATRHARIAQSLGEVISIHAPRTGSDTPLQNTQRGQRNFNPRSPHGERPCPLLTWRQLSGRFQSTLPARGAT